MIVRVLPEAWADAIEAAVWYGERSQARNEAFFARLKEVIREVAINPKGPVPSK